MQDLVDKATELHRQGQMEQSIDLYRQILASEPGRPDITHNLGMALLGQGELQEGEALVKQFWTQDPGNTNTRGTPEIVASILLQHGYREQARYWLRIAISLAPHNKQLREAWQQCQPPDYLSPEIFDPVCEETLLRYAPRESNGYLYAIDIVGTCNLKCPSCPVGNSGNIERPKGTMPLDTYRDIINKILQESPSSKPEVWLFNWGEPLLHPHLVEMVELLKENNLPNLLSTNLNYAKGVERLARAAPDRIKISLSGFHPETYSQSHSGGDIETVKAHMHQLRNKLDEYGAMSEVWVGHHIYRHNFHEQDEVREFCEELGFSWQPVQAFWQPIEKLISMQQNSNLADPLLSSLMMNPVENAAQVKVNRKKNYDCELRFNQTVINVDASVSLCCSVYNPENMLDINFLEHSYEDIVKSKYQHGFCKQCRASGFDYSISNLPVSLQRRSSET
jgi:pyruvate-formate lyase-activating enzyme